MRRAFIAELADLAERHPSIVFLTADIGFSVVEPFARRFPDRFVNVGVAEQNMMGLATGMAEAGWTPFVYSIAPFTVLRPYEFIRNGPVAHHLPVRIVGVGAGMEYGHNGVSHFGLEDVGVLRLQPGLAIVAPADCRQARTALRQTWSRPGPVYYRLSKNPLPDIPELDGRFDMANLQILRDGAQVGIVALGGAAGDALETARMLAAKGIDCGVASVSCLNPAPIDALLTFIRRYRHVVTVEAHYVDGGLGSVVAEAIADQGLPCRLLRLGVSRFPKGDCGTEKDLNEMLGLSPESMSRAVRAALYRPERT